MYKIALIVSIALRLLNNPIIFTPETVPVEPGTYFVEVYYDGPEGEVSTITRTTIGSKNFASEVDIAIDANDIYTTKDQELDADFLLTQSNAKAWNLQNDERYAIDKINAVQIDEKTFEVEFSTVKDVSTTINVYIVDNSAIYNPFLVEANEEYVEHYVYENYITFFILIVITIILIIALLLLFDAQIRVRKQLKSILTISKK